MSQISSANIEYWDFPGKGTKTFPAKTYFQGVKLAALRVFMLCLSKLYILTRASLLALAKSIYYLPSDIYFPSLLKSDKDLKSVRGLKAGLSYHVKSKNPIAFGGLEESFSSLTREESHDL